MWLAGDGCYVLKIGVVVQDHSAVVLGHRCGQQVKDPGGAVVPSCSTSMAAMSSASDVHPG